MLVARLAAALVVSAALCGVAVADEWNAVRLRGQVLQLVDGSWQPLHRGDVVPDGNVVRTLGSGMVDLVRGNETVSLQPNTQIVIADQNAKKPFTVVSQYFGTVAVEAEVQNVQHFAVVTPFLAAVVKGTRFTVESGRTGASVSVQRGHVAVEDKHDKTHVTLSVGQSARVDKNQTGGAIEVSGTGHLPAVLAADGSPVALMSTNILPSSADLSATAADLAAQAKAAEELAKELGTPEAKAAAEAAKHAADEAKKAADAAKKAEKAAADAAKKANDAARKAAEEAAKQAADEAKKAADEAKKAEEQAEKAAKDAEKGEGKAPPPPKDPKPK